MAWQPLLEALWEIRAEKKLMSLPWSEDRYAKTTKEGSYPFQLVSRGVDPGDPAVFDHDPTNKPNDQDMFRFLLAGWTHSIRERSLHCQPTPMPETR